MEGCKMESSISEQRPMVTRNKSLGSMKCGSILEQIRNHWLLKHDSAPRC